MSQSSLGTDNRSNHTNFDLFRDCVSGPIIQKLVIAPAKRSKSKTGRERKVSAAGLRATDELIAENDGDDLADFVDVGIMGFGIPGGPVD